MADLGLTSTLAGWGLGTFKVVAYIGGAAVIAGLCYYAYHLFKTRKKYDYVVRIWEQRPEGSNHLVQCGSDIGGVFLDKKTNNRLFKIKGVRCDLKSDRIPYFYGPKNNRIVDVLRKGLKEYVYLKQPILDETTQKITLGVEDIDIAFAANEIERIKQYEKKTTLQQLMPFIGMGMVFLVVVIALYFIFVKAGFNSETLTRLAETNQKISENLAKIAELQKGTLVIPGGGG